jgi:hypothetical protein
LDLKSFTERQYGKLKRTAAEKRRLVDWPRYLLIAVSREPGGGLGLLVACPNGCTVRDNHARPPAGAGGLAQYDSAARKAAGLCSETAFGVAFKVGELIGLYTGRVIQGGNAWGTYIVYHHGDASHSAVSVDAERHGSRVKYANTRAARKECNAELTTGAGGVIEARATREIMYHQEILLYNGDASKNFVTG